MTWSAPRLRTSSRFRVLHTPVTSAPIALAICTANVPTPPEAPLTRTLCPASSLAWSRSAWRAVIPAMGTAAACSKLRAAGFVTRLVSAVAAYSAKAPWHHPKTSSPAWNCVTAAPTASTTPATSEPRMPARGFGTP